MKIIRRSATIEQTVICKHCEKTSTITLTIFGDDYLGNCPECNKQIKFEYGPFKKEKNE